MKPIKIFFFLFLVTSLTRTLLCQAQTPSPKIGFAFLIPLSDETEATAVFLPTHDGQAYLVYSLKDGKIGFFLMIPTTTTPPPNPYVPPQPPIVVPPIVPPVLTTRPLVLITVTEEQLFNTPQPILDFLSQKNGSHFEYTVSMVDSTNPPTNALQWIGKVAGKLCPYSFITDKAGSILWQGQPSPDTQTTVNLLESLSTTTKQICPCPGGLCPPTQGSRPWRK